MGGSDAVKPNGQHNGGAVRGLLMLTEEGLDKDNFGWYDGGGPPMVTVMSGYYHMMMMKMMLTMMVMVMLMTTLMTTAVI